MRAGDPASRVTLRRVPDPLAVSVVVATRDRATRLEALLASLRAQSLGTDRFEVIVVDDGSTDATASVLERERTEGVLALDVVTHERARGPAAARNAGWRQARAPFVAFTDDDTRASERWLAAALDAWADRREVIVQGRTDPDPREADRDGPFSRTLRVESLGPYYQTANVCYPRELLERAGGFDEQTFSVPGGEDADLAWRCFEAGATAVFAPEARVFHAVHRLGPIGKLRVAWRWDETMRLYARHLGMRSTLTYGIFWKKSHYLLVRAAIGLLVPRSWRPLRAWCFAPLVPAYWRRAAEEGGKRWAAPYFVVHDLVELLAVLRGAVRYRTPVI
jgi:glycosyltransferase involved in cell wall biosynthesis